MSEVKKRDLKNLPQGKSLLKVRTSRKSYLFVYLLILILIGVILYIKYNGRYLNSKVFIGVIVLIIIGIKSTEFHRLYTYYEITSHYAIISKGIFTRDIKRIFIPTISDIVLKQNVWQRILNYGNVKIHRYTAGAIIDVKNINNPKNFIEVLESRLNRLEFRDKQ